HFRGSGFKVFARMLEDQKNQVWAIPGKGGGSRAFCDRMNSWAQGEGQPELGYIMWREGGEGAGPLANNIGRERTAAVREPPGLDRIVMLLCGTTNLREISLFPMNQQAMDLLMGAPSEATTKQLRELHIRVNLPNK